jgi:hypothetical protein
VAQVAVRCQKLRPAGEIRGQAFWEAKEETNVVTPQVLATQAQVTAMAAEARLNLQQQLKQAARVLRVSSSWSIKNETCTYLS